MACQVEKRIEKERANLVCHTKYHKNQLEHNNPNT